MKQIIDIIIYLFSILGGIVTVVTIYKWIFSNNKISWSKVEKGILSLKNELITDNYLPTLIVGIGRGGSITGSLLSPYLGNTPVLVIEPIINWSNNPKIKEIFTEVNLQKVLLVAGETHTGGTILKYKNMFNEIGAEEVRFLSFNIEKYPSLRADYYHIESSNSNLELPWYNKNIDHPTKESRGRPFIYKQRLILKDNLNSRKVSHSKISVHMRKTR